MKTFIFFVLLVLGGPAPAEDFKLVYEHYVAPIYPQTLGSAGLPGTVWVTYGVNSHGSIIDLKVEHSTFPELADAVIDAISQWRFKPWTVAEGRPAVVKRDRKVFFDDYTASAADEAWAKNRVLRMSCETLARKVKSFQENQPASRVMDLPAFDTIRRILYKAIDDEKVSYIEGVRLLEEFEAAIPTVIKYCTKNPEEKYVKQLPANIHTVL